MEIIACLTQLTWAAQKQQAFISGKRKILVQLQDDGIYFGNACKSLRKNKKELFQMVLCLFWFISTNF